VFAQFNRVLLRRHDAIVPHAANRRGDGFTRSSPVLIIPGDGDGLGLLALVHPRRERLAEARERGPGGMHSSLRRIAESLDWMALAYSAFMGTELVQAWLVLR
jgi:hypothetical protein